MSTVNRALALAKLIKTKKATTEHKEELKTLLPETWREICDLTELNELQLMKLVTGNNAPEQAHIRMSLRENLRQVKAGLGLESSSVIERLIIEQIALSWLRVQVMDLLASSADSVSQQDHLSRRAKVAHGRFLRSCESLTRIRKIMTQTPALQINIAQKQISTV